MTLSRAQSDAEVHAAQGVAVIDLLVHLDGPPEPLPSLVGCKRLQGGLPRLLAVGERSRPVAGVGGQGVVVRETP